MKVSLYQDAKIYDILHWPGTDKEVRGLLKIAQRFCDRPARTFLEPACGSGRYLRALTGRGVNVIGFDLGASMVEYASQTVTAARDRKFPRGKKPSVHIFKGDMRTFAKGLKPASADFAFNPINTIRHLGSDKALVEHLNQVARVLRPGGAYMVGLSLSAYGLEGITEDVWTGKRGPCHVTQVITYFPPKGPGAGTDRDEHVHSHLTITTRAGATDSDSSYVLRAYNLRQWQQAVARSTLSIVASVDEFGRDHPAAEPGYCIFVLKHADAPRPRPRASKRITRS